MPLENVTDEVLRPSPHELIPAQQPVLEPVNNALDIEAVSSQLRRELDLVGHLVIRGKDADVPYTPNLTKCQRKKIAKAAGYQTHPMGPPPNLRLP